MAGQPLTAEEQAWANENAEAVRALMEAKGKKAPAVLPEDPVEAATLSLLNSMKTLSSKITSEMERKRNSLDRYIRMAKDAEEREDTESAALYSEEKTELEGEIVRFEQHLDALTRKIEALKADPEASFLPLGAVVRFIGVPDYENSLSLSDDRKSYPEAGSIGVVTRLNRKGENAIGVSMRNDYKDGWGSTYYPDYDRMPTYFVDREMLVVEEYGRLPDGADYRGYGFQPTHIREPEKDGTQAVEMVLEAGGHFWRFHDFGGTQSIEALQAYDHMDEMSWIEGPLDHFVTSSRPDASRLPEAGL